MSMSNHKPADIAKLTVINGFAYSAPNSRRQQHTSCLPSQPACTWGAALKDRFDKAIERMRSHDWAARRFSLFYGGLWLGSVPGWAP